MKFIEDLAKAKILVIGDIMLDRYWWGSVSRISPEAPVPIVRLDKASVAAGGAANVAANVAGLGATPILIGIVGADPEADAVRASLAECGVSPSHLVEVASRPTTVKTRIIAHSQQVARVDHEVDEPLSAEASDTLVKSISGFWDDIGAIVISDYAKGVLTSNLLSWIFEASRERGKQVLVDPKGKNYSKYHGASLLTPNRQEAAEACNLEENGQDVIEVSGRRLMSDHKFDAVLITQGEQGMTLFNGKKDAVHFPAMARQVYDVTGAGDTVIATLAASIGAGADLEQAAKLANIAAGIVVEQVGTTTIKASELKNALNGQ